MPAFKEVVDVPLVVRHSRRQAHEVSNHANMQTAIKDLQRMEHSCKLHWRRINRRGRLEAHIVLAV